MKLNQIADQRLAKTYLEYLYKMQHSIFLSKWHESRDPSWINHMSGVIVCPYQQSNHMTWSPQPNVFDNWADYVFFESKNFYRRSFWIKLSKSFLILRHTSLSDWTEKFPVYKICLLLDVTYYSLLVEL